jgi:hypothetical protein
LKASDGLRVDRRGASWEGVPLRIIIDRMIRASRGDVSFFRGVKTDPAATIEASVVLAVTTVAAAIGQGLSLVMQGRPEAVMSVALLAIGSVVSFAVFTGLIATVGKHLFKADTSWVEVWRSVAYAYSPDVLLVVSFIPVVGDLVTIVVGAWTLYLLFGRVSISPLARPSR